MCSLVLKFDAVHYVQACEGRMTTKCAMPSSPRSQTGELLVMDISNVISETRIISHLQLPALCAWLLQAYRPELLFSERPAILHIFLCRHFYTWMMSTEAMCNRVVTYDARNMSL
jgi:hypothetical protein